MSNTKKWLIIGAVIVLFGLIAFGGVMTVLKWDFTKLSTYKYVTNSYEINEEFKNISIDIDTANIVFLPSEGSKATVETYEQKKIQHTVDVKEDTLTIEVSDTRKWYEHIGIGFSSPKITVKIPNGEYGKLKIDSSTGKITIPSDYKFESIDISGSTGNVSSNASASGEIKIKTSTGDICVENISAASLDLAVSTGGVKATNIICENDFKINVSTGKTNICDIKCNSFTSDGNTGDLTMKNVIAKEKLSVERSTGDVKLEGCDAYEIYIKTDTGNVKGTLLSEKIFMPSTDTGKIDVPKTVTGGRCEIITDTGDIKITLE